MHLEFMEFLAVAHHTYIHTCMHTYIHTYIPSSPTGSVRCVLYDARISLGGIFALRVLSRPLPVISVKQVGHWERERERDSGLLLRNLT